MRIGHLGHVADPFGLVGSGSSPSPPSILPAAPAWWWLRRRPHAPAGPLVVAGWVGVELADDADPWGIDPAATTLEN